MQNNLLKLPLSYLSTRASFRVPPHGNCIYSREGPFKGSGNGTQLAMTTASHKRFKLLKMA